MYTNLIKYNRMDKANRKEEQTKRINQIKRDFLLEFGIELFISMKGISNVLRLELDVLTNTINDIINKEYPGVYPNGLKTKNRKHIIVNFRYCFYKIAIDMGYTPSILEFYSGFDRCSVLHGYGSINDLLLTKHPLTLYNLNTIYNELQERFGIDAVLRTDQPL